MREKKRKEKKREEKKNKSTNKTLFDEENAYFFICLGSYIGEIN